MCDGLAFEDDVTCEDPLDPQLDQPLPARRVWEAVVLFVALIACALIALGAL